MFLKILCVIEAECYMAAFLFACYAICLHWQSNRLPEESQPWVVNRQRFNSAIVAMLSALVLGTGIGAGRYFPCSFWGYLCF